MLALALLPLVAASPGLLSELRAASSASASCPLQLVCAALQTREPGLASLRAAPFMAGLLALAGDTAGNSSEAAADTADSAFLHQLRAAADTGAVSCHPEHLLTTMTLPRPRWRRVCGPGPGLRPGGRRAAAGRGGAIARRPRAAARPVPAAAQRGGPAAPDHHRRGQQRLRHLRDHQQHLRGVRHRWARCRCRPPLTLCPGSFKACLVSILGGPVAVGVCNAVATPGRIGCVINTALCFLKGCGAVRLPRITRRP